MNSSPRIPSNNIAGRYFRVLFDLKIKSNLVWWYQHLLSCSPNISLKWRERTCFWFAFEVFVSPQIAEFSTETKTLFPFEKRVKLCRCLICDQLHRTFFHTFWMELISKYCVLLPPSRAFNNKKSQKLNRPHFFLPHAYICEINKLKPTN